jgi:HEAT repeat protein
MIRLVSFVAPLMMTVMLVPTSASAQVPPPLPRPPAPPSPLPAPPVLHAPWDQTVPLAPLAGEAWLMAVPEADWPHFDDFVFDDQRLHLSVPSVDLASEAWDLAFQRSLTTNFAPRSPESRSYNSAMSALRQRDYEAAVARFDHVVTQQGPRADAALHWKAFALFKMGEAQAALDSIAALRRDYPESRYLSDAKVLEAEIQARQGRAADPATIDDDEIRILAIQGIQRSDPETALPLLEDVLVAANSLRVKQQALYVMALSEQARAHEVLLDYARGEGNPELQVQAIGYVATRRDGRTTGEDLRSIYESTEDEAVRLAVIGAYRSAGDKSALSVIASDLTAPVTLRSSAVGNLSNLAAPEELWVLYEREPDARLRTQMVQVFNVMRSVDHIVRIVRTEEESGVRNRAIRYLGNRETAETGPTLVQVYNDRDDEGTRKAVIDALARQENAEALVSIARTEKSRDLTLQIVGSLSGLAGTSDVAAKYLMEIIKR